MGNVQQWATTRELAAHYIACAHEAAHNMRYAGVRTPRGQFQSQRSWNAEVAERQERFRTEIETLRALARDLVPDPQEYAEVAQDAIRRAADVTCSQCYGRVALAEVDGDRPPFAGYERPITGGDGIRYYRCSSIKHRGKAAEYLPPF